MWLSLYGITLGEVAHNLEVATDDWLSPVSPDTSDRCSMINLEVSDGKASVYGGVQA